MSNNHKIYFCYYVTNEYKSELSKLKKTIPKSISILYSIGDDITVDQFILDCANKIDVKNATIIFFYAGHSFSYYLRNGTKYIPIQKLRITLEKLKPIMCVFDSCALATLECLYELRNCTKYILACEGYGSDYGFLTKNTLSYLDEYSKTKDIVYLGKLMLNDGYLNNKFYHKPWNGTFCCTKNISILAKFLSNPNLTHIPYVCNNYALVDIGKWFRVDTSSVVIAFRQNKMDSPNCSGISFSIWVNRKRDFDWYSKCQLYKDFEWVRIVHSICDYDKRVLEVDLDMTKITKKFLEKIKEESEADEVVNPPFIQKNSIINYQNRYDDLENNISGFIKHYRLKTNLIKINQ